MRRPLETPRNLLTNSRMAGAGAPSTPPRGWRTFEPDTGAGMSALTFTEPYQDDGLWCVDVRLQGTAGAGVNGNTNIFFGAYPASVPARQGDTFTISAFARLKAGTFPDYIGIGWNEVDAAQGYLASAPFSGVNVTAAGIREQRWINRAAITHASAAFLDPQLVIGYSASDMVDVTLQLGFPMLTRGLMLAPPVDRLVA